MYCRFLLIVFYHRAKGEHPERKKSIKITNKTTPQKTGVRSMPVCQSAVLIYSAAAASNVMDTHYTTHVQHDWLQGARTGSTVRAHAALH